jgi:hypothetical protein
MLREDYKSFYFKVIPFADKESQFPPSFIAWASCKVDWLSLTAVK